MLHYFIVTSRLWEQRNIFCTFRKRYFFAPTQILSQMRLPVEVSLHGLLSKSFIIFAILQSIIAGIWRKTCLISAPVSEYHLEDSNSCRGEISRVFSHPRTIFIKKETHSRRYNNRLWLLILILVLSIDSSCQLWHDHAKLFIVIMPGAVPGANLP